MNSLVAHSVATDPESCQFPSFRRKFFSSVAWGRELRGVPDTDTPTNSDGSKSQVTTTTSSSSNHIQRPTFLRTLDLKALPTNDSLSNNSPSETQKRRTKYLFFEKQCSKISDGLYLSGDLVAKNWDLLQENGVTHVVNCVGFICQEYFKERHITYRTYFLQDTPAEDILCILYDAFEFIDTALQQGGRVLVHCSQGVSRSATIVIAYLMWKTGLTYDDAFATVKTARGVSNPNIGFCCQLLQWQKRRQPKAAMRVRLYRIGPHSQYAPTQLVPKVVVPPKQYCNNTFRDLDSRGAFVIQSPELMYVWIGVDCPPTIATSAEYHARLYPKYESANNERSKPVVVVRQDEETAEFIALMDPPLLNPDQQRINARRNSITGDLLAGTSGLTGFSSLGLALGSCSTSSTPRSGSPTRDRGGAGAGGGVEHMDISDSDREGGHIGLRGRRSKNTMSPAPSLPGSPLGQGVSAGLTAWQLPSSRLQVATTRGDVETAGGVCNMEDDELVGWLVDEVDEYSADYHMYSEAFARQQGPPMLLSQSMCARGEKLAAATGSSNLSASPPDNHMKKYRRSDCGGQLPDSYQRLASSEQAKGNGQVQKTLHSSFDDEDVF